LAVREIGSSRFRLQRRNPLAKPAIKVKTQANQINKEINLKSVAVIEEGSVIKRNNLVLEQVMIQR
jgi:hypothetical protein